MDSIDQLLHLRQGGLSIEEYVHQFCELSYQVPLYDEILFKDLFHFGLNRHIKSLFPGGEFKGSLRGFIDCALLCAGSSLTVGVSDEERNTAPETKMADAPEGTHKMAEATMHHQFPESHNMPAKPQFAHVMPTKPGSAHVMPTEPGSALIVPAKPGSALIVPAKPGSALIVPAKPGSVFVMPAMPESPAKMATTPADAPLGPGLIASVSQELAESAPEPTPIQELTESSSPEPLMVPSGSPEPLLAPSGSPSSLLVPSSSAPPERP